MVPVGKGGFVPGSRVAADVLAEWRQEAPLQLVLQVHVILRGEAQAGSEKHKTLSAAVTV